MPTGYTADVPKGITPRQFMLRCVRAMGVLVTMREEPSGAPVPRELEPHTYHRDRLPSARAGLAQLEAMEPSQVEAACREHGEAATALWRRRIEEDRRTRASYEAMLGHVRAWTPPTPEHQGFKDFMVDQLEGSIRHDCGDWSEPGPLRPGDWHAEMVADARREVERHEREWRAEQERTEGRNEWLRAFWDALPPEADDG